MPSLRERAGVGTAPAALFVADLHLREKPAIARSVEKDWVQVQALYLAQLQGLQMKYNVPVFVAGDIFDRWENSSYFVNKVISWFRNLRIHAIPGNHDTPYHNALEVGRSSYWTLVEAGVLNHLTPGGPYTAGCVTVHPFPFGTPPHEMEAPGSGGDSICLQVALVHDYAWVKGYGHPQASEQKRYPAWEKTLKGYDLAVFGDNHKHFFVDSPGRLRLFNCGTFMRRHSDERDEEPGAGLLYSDGSVERIPFDCRQDRFLRLDQEVLKVEEALEVNLADFAGELTRVQEQKVSYARTVLAWANREGVPDRVIEILLKVLHDVKE